VDDTLETAALDPITFEAQCIDGDAEGLEFVLESDVV
jgi:hypothetical protein